HQIAHSSFISLVFDLKQKAFAVHNQRHDYFMIISNGFTAKKKPLQMQRLFF
ncbi:MAG: hypothetical protein ACI828_001041, partial [Flavobacteriales bacterium]